MIDPCDLADNLPDRPLKPDEVEEVFDRIGWSIMPVVHEADGTEYVPVIYAHDEENQRAIGMSMDDQMKSWDGEVMREGVDLSTWLEVNQKYAAEMGTEVEPGSLVFEDGTRRDLDG